MHGSSEGSDDRGSLEALSRRIAALEEQVAAQERIIEGLRVKEALLARTEDEHRLMRAALDCCTDFVGIASLDGKGLHVNTAGRRLVGLASADEVQSTVNADYVMPEDVSRLEKEIVPIVVTEGRWEGELRCRHMPTGEPIVVAYSGYLVRHPETGAPLGLATVMRDLRAEQGEAEERQRLLEQQSAAAAALRHEQARMSSLDEERQQMIAAVEACADFIGICTLDGRTIYCNAAGRRLIGYDVDADMRGFEVIQAFTPAGGRHFLEHIVPAIRATGRWEGELEFKHLQTGEPFPTQYNAFLIRDQHTGQPICIGAVTRDLRAARRAEQERRRLLDEIIRAQASMLAELSTPLIPISDRVVVMPLIGTVDEARAEQVLESLLSGVTARNAKVAILDITGVATVDVAVAEALLHAAKAVRLLGAEVVLTGIRAEVAQALIEIGVDLGNIVTRSTVQSGIAFAMRRA
ncbi:STAS domain-containing protein [Polyangium sp. 6x1]|uniref:STAS domain-containing protein n=1 Tax=Polyangium sp. 6x1 TaxID=3042689 RepID=UPI0024832C85|nr:STAS domain-containing protein [Polyangium sp. 6x1]MDI1451250.1 PAS domain S-box protein [Polyangium sp. 6x1]